MLKGSALGGFMPPSGMLRGYSVKSRSILTAYSGGADSACLLYLLSDWCRENGWEISAAHVNHGIRGAEALRDREHCKKICEKLGIKLFILDADVPRIAEERKMSIEGAAREVRYEFFASVMEENNIPILATAHNADDNLETIIFRLARGTGLRGLCGIPPVRELEGKRLVIRPILSMTKQEILDTCSQNGIEYVYDSTNSETVYARNSIRANILPVLRSINPDAAGAVLRSSELLREDSALLDSLSEEYLKSKDHNKVSELAKTEKPIFYRAVARLYSQHSTSHLEYTHLEALHALVGASREHSSLSLPGRVKASIEGGKLIFSDDTRKKINNEELPLIMLIEGDNQLPGGHMLSIEYGFSTLSSHSTPQIQRNDENIYKLFTHVYLQSDKINGSLFARGRLPGDRIKQGGISKDVRKLISEHGVPLKDRSSYPIICDKEGILWIPDIALRDGVKINKNEKNSQQITKLTLWRTSLKG